MADLGSLLGAAGVGGIIGQAIVKLELDTSKYSTELKGAEAETTASANMMGSGMSKFGGIAQTAMIGAGVAVAAFGAASIKAFIDSEKIMAQTEAVLKSTGSAAHVTKDQVLALADQIRDLSGVDNDAVQASENLLLTFRDIRNEAGKGNDIFNQTEKAIVDMATAMNKGAIPSMEDLHNTTIQVGKALNDPIQGMSALRRVGVSFTESQVAMITKLQESGDLMGAQKIILQELQKEFGGAAKAAGDTFAGQMAKLQSQFGDIEEEVGQALIPALEGLASALEGLVPVLEKLAQAIQFLPLVQLGDDFNSSASGVSKFGNAVLDTIPVLGHFVDINDDWKDSLVQAVAQTNLAITSQDTMNGELRRGEFAQERLTKATDTFVEKSRSFAHQWGETLRTWKADVKDSFDTFVLSLEEGAEQTKITRHEFMDATRVMQREAQQLNAALIRISKEKWVNDDYIKFLSEQGPEWLIGFANLTKEQQKRAQDAWEETKRKTDAAKTGFDQITNSLEHFNKKETHHKVIIEYDYVGFDPSKPGMAGGTRTGRGGQQ